MTPSSWRGHQQARTPRMTKESELKGTADTVEMEAPTKGLFVGRDKSTKRKLTLQSTSNTGLPEEERNDGRIRTIPSQSAYHAQQEFGDRTSFEDNGAVEQDCSPHCCSGMPTRSASRVVSRVSLRTEIGAKVKN